MQPIANAGLDKSSHWHQAAISRQREFLIVP
jgi:hypothetical protein